MNAAMISSAPYAPKVSIGMPVYNGEPFIREALDSLLAQTFTDFELIISDNASTDSTEATCREYAVKDPRIRYVRQAENCGALANFQFVLDEAVGKFFMWAAADDVWECNWIKVLLPIAERHQCLAYGTVVPIDENGALLINPAYGRRLEYSGNKLVRRIKYFFAKPSLGKANPVYGLVPRRLLKKEQTKVFRKACAGSDMLFLFILLNTTEIKSPDTVTRLFKRIHAGCAAPPPVKKDGGPINVVRLIKLFAASMAEPFFALYAYSKYADFLEICVFCSLALPMALRNVIVSLRFAAQQHLRNNHSRAVRLSSNLHSHPEKSR